MITAMFQGFDMIISGALPRRLIFERGGINKLPEIISELGLIGKCMLVTGRKFARSSGYLNKLMSLLESAGIENVIVFDRVEPNPSAGTVDEGGKIAAEEGVDFVIGFGGGSAMDAAKGIAIVAVGSGSVREYFYPAEVRHLVLPVIAIPTTCGTGSEVTRYAVISDAGKKNSIRSNRIVPVAAILDADVLDYLSNDVLSHTVMDALSHAIESYFHVGANDLTYMFSAESAKIIFENFARALDGEPESKEKLFYASMLAGFAINFSGTVVVHGLGYYLTEKHGIPHGLANTLFLSSFIEYSSKKISDRLVSLCKRLGISSEDPVECSRALIRRLTELRRYAKLPLSLFEAGIGESEFKNLVEEGLSYRRSIENCVVPPTRDDIEQMVRGAYTSIIE